jgi:hypothetical protein
MTKIQYPSFWEVSEIPDSKIVSFISPLETTAVIVHNIPTPSESADEVLMNMLAKIKNNLPNVTITDTDISHASDGSVLQTLMFTYGDDSNPNIYKVFQLLKTYKDKTYVFTYHSSESLFDRFIPLVSQMYNSYQVPSFDNVFPPDVYSKDSSQVPNFKGFSLDMDSNSSTKLNEITKTTNLTTSDNIVTDENDTINDKPNDQNIDSKIFTIYNSESLGLSVQYPMSFHKTDEINRVSFTSMDEKAEITIGKFPTFNNSLKEYSLQKIKSKQTLPNFKVIKLTQSEYFGFPTQMLLYKYTNSDNSQQYKTMELWKIEENMANTFAYTANLEVADRYLPIVVQMLETIKWY